MGDYATLHDEAGGINKVIRTLQHLASVHPRKTSLATELAYFRKHRKRMRFTKLQSKELMIGSGVVEAACKTLVTQRLKQSGMRWSVSGAQAILPPRGWDQSDRFDEAWALIAATFEVEVIVTALKRQPASKKNRP